MKIHEFNVPIDVNHEGMGKSSVGDGLLFNNYVKVSGLDPGDRDAWTANAIFPRSWMTTLVDHRLWWLCGIGI